MLKINHIAITGKQANNKESKMLLPNILPGTSITLLKIIFEKRI